MSGSDLPNMPGGGQPLNPAARARRPVGLTSILLATAVAGAAGYVVQIIVGVSSEPSDYLRFSVFWALLYLVISGLSGVQQEVSRATRGETIVNSHFRGGSTARNFAIVLAGAIALATPLTALWWGTRVFPSHTWVLVAALSVGLTSYVLVAVISGILYGMGAWSSIALMTGLDGVLRLIAIGLAAVLQLPGDFLIWAVVVPFPLTLLVMWPRLRRRVPGRFTLDVEPKALAWNSLRIVGGATATGVIVSGFPLILDLTSKHESAAAVGVLVLAVTLTRAPLVIPLMALQSFLTVHFRESGRNLWRVVAVILAVVALAALVASALAWFLGPPLMVALFGAEYEISSMEMSLIVSSAGVTAALCVTGPAVLSRGKHGAFLAGWVVAAAVLVLILLMPADLVARALMALSVGPLIGLAIHLGALAFARPRPTAGLQEQTPL